MQKTGIETAWEKIRGLLAPGSGGGFPGLFGIAFENGAFKFRCLGMDFLITPGDRTIRAADENGRAFLPRLSYFFNHFALWWLVCSSRGIPQASGRFSFLRPQELASAGAFSFFRGSHTLPLDALAGRYRSDCEGFSERARDLGFLGPAPAGQIFNGTGDCSALLEPAPGFPVNILLWLEDEEFPARAEVLVPSWAGVILPLDIVWCALMLCLLPMLKNSQ